MLSDDRIRTYIRTLRAYSCGETPRDTGLVGALEELLAARHVVEAAEDLRAGGTVDVLDHKCTRLSEALDHYRRRWITIGRRWKAVMASERAKKAAREALERADAECPVLTEVDVDSVQCHFAQALDAYAEERVREERRGIASRLRELRHDHLADMVDPCGGDHE